MDTSTDGDDSSRPTSSLAMATAGTANGEDSTSMKAIMATLNNANASSSLDTGAVNVDQHEHQKPTQVINPPLYQGNDIAQQPVSNYNLNLNRMPSSGTSDIPMAMPIAVNDASMSNIVNNNVMAMATIVNNDGVIIIIRHLLQAQVPPTRISSVLIQMTPLHHPLSFINHQ